MPPVGFEHTVSAGERPQTYVLDRAAIGAGFQELLLVLISVRGWVDPTAIVQPEGLVRWRLQIETATFWLVGRCLTQLGLRVPRKLYQGIQNITVWRCYSTHLEKCKSIECLGYKLFYWKQRLFFVTADCGYRAIKISHKESHDLSNL